jgi:hypothetical protein
MLSPFPVPPLVAATVPLRPRFGADQEPKTKLLGQSDQKPQSPSRRSIPRPMLPPFFDPAKMEPSFASHTKATGIYSECEPVSPFGFLGWSRRSPRLDSRRYHTSRSAHECRSIPFDVTAFGSGDCPATPPIWRGPRTRTKLLGQSDQKPQSPSCRTSPRPMLPPFFDPAKWSRHSPAIPRRLGSTANVNLSLRSDFWVGQDEALGWTVAATVHRDRLANKRLLSFAGRFPFPPLPAIYLAKEGSGCLVGVASPSGWLGR